VSDPPEAFLSYTRLDDEYFGGVITSLRGLLELGVQVVTGDRTFNIFQDVDGIEFGQKWKKRLTEAISTSRFLVPVVTPLFFKSDPCRDELRQFIEHEKSLGRDDLILPIYFVTAPVLERPELLKDDTLASEIGSRQRYDCVFRQTCRPTTRRCVAPFESWPRRSGRPSHARQVQFPLRRQTCVETMPTTTRLPN
jgi:TIR domain